jgi:hypothetical protein
MTKLEAITIRLHPKEIGVLKKYHKQGLTENTQHFVWEKINESLKLDYSTLKALDALGFVRLELEKRSLKTVYDSYFLTLFPSAIYRAEFENYGEFKKWYVKQYLNYKDWIALLGFIISIFLLILKVLEFVGT